MKKVCWKPSYHLLPHLSCCTANRISYDYLQSAKEQGICTHMKIAVNSSINQPYINK